MNYRLILVLGACLQLLLAGCASMSKEECLHADWRTVGYEDGAQGRGAEAIAAHRKACAKAAVTPDLDAYEAGREAGLEEFCRPARAYDYARRGGSYAGVCPADSEAAFLEAYEDGRRYYELEQAVAQSESAINSLRHRIDRARDTIRERERLLNDDTLSRAERDRIQDKLRELESELARLEQEQAQHLIDLGTRLEQLRAYESGSY